MDTNGHQFLEKSRPRIALITSAFARGYGETSGCLESNRGSPNFGERYLSARRTSTTITLFTASSSQYIQPVRDRIVTDDFDLPGLERGILIGIVPLPFSKGRGGTSPMGFKLTTNEHYRAGGVGSNLCCYGGRKRGNVGPRQVR